MDYAPCRNNIRNAGRFHIRNIDVAETLHEIRQISHTPVLGINHFHRKDWKRIFPVINTYFRKGFERNVGEKDRFIGVENNGGFCCQVPVDICGKCGEGHRILFEKNVHFRADEMHE